MSTTKIVTTYSCNNCHRTEDVLGHDNFSSRDRPEGWVNVNQWTKTPTFWELCPECAKPLIDLIRKP